MTVTKSDQQRYDEDQLTNDTIRAMEDEIDRLHAIVDALDKTEDGQPIYPGRVLYRAEEFSPYYKSFPWPSEPDKSGFFSTRRAAVAIGKTQERKWDEKHGISR